MPSEELSQKYSIFQIGLALLQPDGCVSWCDSQMTKIVSADINGLYWGQLGQDIWQLQNSVIAEQLFSELVSNLSQSISIDIRLKNVNDRQNQFQLIMEPVFNSENGNLDRIVLSLYPRIGINAGLVEKGKSLVANHENSQKISRDNETDLLLQAVKQSNDSVMITDRDGLLVYVNPQFCKTTGYSREEAIGRNSNILKSGAHNSEFYQEIWTAILAGKVWHGQFTNRKKDGMLFREEATISPLVNNAGEVTNFFATKRDVTREDTLERQLQQAMKMEAIGTLAGGIAHDFNTILSEIIGYSQSACFKLEKDSKVHNDLNKVLASADRAVDLVKQILTFARQNSRHMFRILEVQHVIKETVKLIGSSLPKNIDLKQSVDESCGPILADPGQIHQLLVNLCKNARQAIGDEDGTITITLAEHEAKETRVGSGGRQTVSGKYVQLTVQDTGCGMERKELARIFDPFFTTRKKTKGTGLGLAVVHGIVKAHQGGIYVDSELGKGSTFNVFFSVTDTEK